MSITFTSRYPIFNSAETNTESKRCSTYTSAYYIHDSSNKELPPPPAYEPLPTYEQALAFLKETDEMQQLDNCIKKITEEELLAKEERLKSTLLKLIDESKTGSS